MTGDGHAPAALRRVHPCCLRADHEITGVLVCYAVYRRARHQPRWSHPGYAPPGPGCARTLRLAELRLGGTGQEVRSGDWLALYNQTARDCLIYFDRTVGGDIGWPGSETWTDQIEDAVMQAIRDHWKEAVAYLLSE